MRILMISPELTPFSKAGGLGDMVASLTKALAALGHEVRVFTPKYGNLTPRPDWVAHPTPVWVDLNPAAPKEYCRVWKAPFEGATALFLEYDTHFGSAVIYDDKADNGRRFGFFSRAAIDYCEQDTWIPDIVHCHDWTTGLVPVFLNTRDAGKPIASAASVMTIHNLLHQGFCHKSLLGYLGMPGWLDSPAHLEAVGGLNLMKGGLWHATKITTVSPTYAREIHTGEFGCGLDDLLRTRSADLIGIVNGVDTDDWNPAEDKHLPANYSPADMSGKSVCKKKLQAEAGLTVDDAAPLFGVVSRLWEQKGLDLLADAADSLLERSRMQLILLGNGDKALEARYTALAARWPGRVSVRIGFDNALSHRIEAGADFFLMPSRFEPCGLNQLYSMRYGTPPIVRATGGLADTVEPWYAGRGTGTGIVFKTANRAGLIWAVEEALRLYDDAPGEYAMVRKNGMTRDFAWGESAKRYVEVYRWALEIRRHSRR